MITIVAAAALITAVVYLYGRSFPAPTSLKESENHFVEEPVFGAYTYLGLKKELRKLYEILLLKLRGLGMQLKPGYTPREVAKASSRTVLAELVSWFTSIYERYMYGTSVLRKRELESVRRRVTDERV